MQVLLYYEQIHLHHIAVVGAKTKKACLTIILFYCSAVINFLHCHSHQLQVLYLDGEELTDISIHAVSACPLLRCLRVSFSGQLTDRCLLSLKVYFKFDFVINLLILLKWKYE